MKFLKRLRKLRWICLLFFIFDKSKGYCVGDLLEEYDELCKRAGKVKAIKWLCKQVVSSSSYLISNPLLRASTWCKNSWAKVITPIKSFGITSAKIASRFRAPFFIRIYTSAFLLLLLLSLAFYIFQLAPKTPRLEAQYQELIPKPDLIDPKMPTVALKQRPLLRSSVEDSITRIEESLSTSYVRFQLEIYEGEIGKSYRVTLTSMRGGEMLTVPGLKIVDKNISIILPMQLIPEGDYILTVSQDEEGPIQDYFIRVKRKGNTKSLDEE